MPSCPRSDDALNAPTHPSDDPGQGVVRERFPAPWTAPGFPPNCQPAAAAHRLLGDELPVVAMIEME
jgi:hypothetical protein